MVDRREQEEAAAARRSRSGKLKCIAFSLRVDSECQVAGGFVSKFGTAQNWAYIVDARERFSA